LTNAVSFRLGNTHLHGDLDSVACLEGFYFEADCGGDSPEVNCTCCDMCCADAVDQQESDCEPNIPGICRKESMLFERDEDRGTVCTCNGVVDQKACQGMKNFRTWELTDQAADDDELSPADSLLPVCDPEEVMSFSCNDNCTACNLDGSVCAVSKDYGWSYADNGYWTFYQATVEYVKGRDEVVTFVYGQAARHVLINGEKCDSVVFRQCSDFTYSLVIDCRNINAEFVLDTCDIFQTGGGVLEIFSHSFQQSACRPPVTRCHFLDFEC
jgi:hypothetical protein